MEEKNYENDLVLTETENTELNVWDGEEDTSTGSSAGKFVGGVLVGTVVALVATKVIPFVKKKVKEAKDKKAEKEMVEKYLADKERARNSDSVAVDEELE